MVRSTCKPGDKLKEGRRSFTIFYERLERRPTGSLTTAVVEGSTKIGAVFGHTFEPDSIKESRAYDNETSPRAQFRMRRDSVITER